jgi:putative transposase
MGIPRSTFYDAPAIASGDAEIVTKIAAICDEFESYGYRRVGAALRHQGVIVNSKKVRRLMREHGLQPKRPAPLRHHHRQRSQWSDLSQSRRQHGARGS